MKKTEKSPFKLSLPFQPSGDQPGAIAQLVKNRPGKSVLLGVTGSGKTFTLANVIAQQSKNVLIMSPNKTLAAQLYEEFSLFFPENKVCYFVSYYDYYQPESYLPAQDIYVAKETKVNSEIERLRVEATASIINRNDVIVISSVSAIYSLGNPFDYKDLAFSVRIGDTISRRDLLAKLIFIQYKRNDVEAGSGQFRVVGNTVTVNLPYLHDSLRIELFGDTIETIEFVDKREHKVLRSLDNFVIFPAKHFVATEEKREAAVINIKADLEVALANMQNPLYKERLKTRIQHDIDMISETGYCSGIENYSRYFDGRKEGSPPYSLFDFFGDDFLLIIDESHVAVPQFYGMYKGDAARKKALIEYGFRLPSAFDNRPLKFEEIERYFKDVIFVSATPAKYELEHADTIAEQIVRPTGILDPVIEIRPREGQITDLINEIKETSKKGFRSLITVLTKKAAEDMAQFLEKQKLKVCYMHSEIKTPQRTELLHKLRLGTFECLVGINLLREGLDLPEVALVAIMDADIESFLRDERSLIQTIGRAARNTDSKVIFYADKITQSMQKAMQETERRRAAQEIYNTKHGITPETVRREVTQSISRLQKSIMDASKANLTGKKRIKPKNAEDAQILITQLEEEMQLAAENLDFEKAINARDKILALRKQFLNQE
ncbi:MAG: excinuclease ABC subunit UvrB [bacterium]